MCNADFSVGTFEWRPNWRRPRPNYIVDHTCVDWDSLESWAMERTFSVFDQKSLIHPELGGFRSVRTMFSDRLANGDPKLRNRFSNREWVHRRYFAWAAYAYPMA